MLGRRRAVTTGTPWTTALPQGDLGAVDGHEIELIHPVDDQAPSYRDFLAAGRERIHHLGWFCDDYDGAAAEQEGRAELQRGDWPGVHFVYHEPTEEAAAA